jgi:hypothetical protein
MPDFGTLKSLDPRAVWPTEAHSFTPWLAEHIEELGEALGLDLELVEREAGVGDFSLDILARDLGTNRHVVIENQLSPTDHDHFGKLLTYAAGFDAGVVVWLSQSIRDEHRQALEWLNQQTEAEVRFFGVVVEVLQIDDSKPAFHFEVVVSPNEWQKERRRGPTGSPTARGEAYREFFQQLLDRLREEHRFTNAKVGQPQNWYSFSSGIAQITYGASFAQGNRVRTEVYIGSGDTEANKRIFDALHAQRAAIETAFGEPLSWERLDGKQASRVAIYADGSIEMDSKKLESCQNWIIERLLRFKAVFGDRIRELVDFHE